MSRVTKVIDSFYNTCIGKTRIRLHPTRQFFRQIL